MSSVTELKDSRVGRQTGLHGSKPTTLQWRVECDAVTDDPLSILKAAKPIGTEHPHDTNVFVQDYSTNERLNTYNWICSTIYGIPLLFRNLVPNADGWMLDGQSSVETYPLRETYENPGTVPKVIGMPVYEPCEQGDHDAVAPGAGPSGLDIYLRKTGKVRPQPYDARLPIVSFSLTKQFPTLDYDAIGWAINNLERINQTVFTHVAAPKRMVRFDAISWRGGPGDLPGAQKGVIWTVRLDFTFCRQEWTPQRYRHLYEDEEGGLIAVLNPQGQYIEEAFNVGELMDMNTLLSNFG